MVYRLRPIRFEDIQEVTDIDQSCFATMLPPPNYKSELLNPMAHYIVAYDDDPPQPVAGALVSPLLPGFGGLWLMAGEAHITTIAVREQYRRWGLGEMIFIGLVEKARQLQATMITLEVRVSNLAAQRLYAKYGLTERGRRRAYYTDNREDAVIMTLDDPCSPGYDVTIEKLKRGYETRWRRDIVIDLDS